MSSEPFSNHPNSRGGGSNDKFVQILSEKVWALEEATNNISQLTRLIGTPKDDSSIRSRMRQYDDTGFRLRNEIEKILRAERDVLMRKGRHTTDNTFRRLEQQSIEMVKKYVQTSDSSRRKVQNSPLPEDKRGGGERVTANPVFQKREGGFGGDEGATMDGPFQFQAEKFASADIQVKEENAREAMKIAQATTELHNVMRDFSVNVEKQGEAILEIEESVTESLERVEIGVKDVAKASQYQNQYRRKCVILGLIFALIIIVVGVLVGLKYSGKL